MKTFIMERIEDVTGASGTGIVAQGVEFDDGSCVLRWMTDTRSTALYSSIEDLERIHLHGGKTKLRFDHGDRLVEVQKPHLALGAEGYDAEFIALTNNAGPADPKARVQYDAVRKILAPHGWGAMACWSVSGYVHLEVRGPERFLRTERIQNFADPDSKVCVYKHFERDEALFKISKDGVQAVTEFLRGYPSEAEVSVDGVKGCVRRTTFSRS